MFREFYIEIEDELTRILQEKNWGTEELKIEEPREIADLATAVAFKLASKEKTKPMKIAEQIQKNIKLDKLNYVKEVESKEPGYVNFYLDYEKLNNFLEQVKENDEDFGKIKESKGQIIVEHTSANPTGPLHIGHLRNAVIGDTLKRILDKSGYSTKTQYYLNDMGKQMAILLIGKRKYGLEKNKPLDKAIGEIYSRINSENDFKEIEVQEIMQKLENQDPKIKKELDNIVEKCFSGIQESLNDLDIEVNEVVKESRFVYDGSVEEVFEQLKPFGKEEEGAFLIEFDDIEKELVLKRKNGTSVYALRDLAYHRWKSQFGSNIDILGSDHKLYAKQLKNALELIGAEPPETIIFEFVSLPEGEMSSRKGDFVSIRELYEKLKEKSYEEVDKRREGSEEWKKKIAEKIAKGALKYDFVKVAPNKPISFDIENAVSFKEQGAPFIQYAYARSHSILEKSNKKDLNEIELENSTSKKLAKEISRFKFVLEKSAKKRRPHLFAEYLFELASSFNEFYRDVPVIGSEMEYTRLGLVKATKIALKEGINTLGFEAPEEM